MTDLKAPCELLFFNVCVRFPGRTSSTSSPIPFIFYFTSYTSSSCAKCLNQYLNNGSHVDILIVTAETETTWNERRLEYGGVHDSRLVLNEGLGGNVAHVALNYKKSGPWRDLIDTEHRHWRWETSA